MGERSRWVIARSLALLFAPFGVAAFTMTSFVAVAIVGAPAATSSSVAEAPSIGLTTVNWGHPVSLLDPAHLGWGHLAPLAGATEVTATIELNGLPVHSWVARLDTPLAYGGQQPEDCRGVEDETPTELSCVFEVSVTSGPNPLTLIFTADGRVVGEAHGSLRGGELQFAARYEVLDAIGWVAMDRDQVVAMPATAPTAVRVVVTNTGSIPLLLERAESGPRNAAADAAHDASCDARLLSPGRQLVCLVRGVRPARSLAGELRRQFRVVDAVGAAAEDEIRASLTTFSGTFSLSKKSALVGESIVIRARGLPIGQAFPVQYRIDDHAVLVGTSVTHTGSLNDSFVVPGSSAGSFRLNVVHEGLTVASLPFDVTLTPGTPDAAISPWALLAIPLVGSVVLLLRLRQRRITASREPSDPDS